MTVYLIDEVRFRAGQHSFFLGYTFLKELNNTFLQQGCIKLIKND